MPDVPVSVVTGVQSVPLVNAPPVVAAVVPTKSEVVAPEVPVLPVVPVVVVPVVPAAAPVPIVADPVVPVVVAAAVPKPVVVPEQVPVVPVVETVAKAAVDEVHAEKNAQDASGILNEPIDKATKLVIDLDEHLKKYLPAEDEIVAAPTTAPHIYAGSDIGEAEGDRQNQMTTLIDQVNRLAESIEVRSHERLSII